MNEAFKSAVECNLEANIYLAKMIIEKIPDEISYNLIKKADYNTKIIEKDKNFKQKISEKIKETDVYGTDIQKECIEMVNKQTFQELCLKYFENKNILDELKLGNEYEEGKKTQNKVKYMDENEYQALFIDKFKYALFYDENNICLKDLEQILSEIKSMREDSFSIEDEEIYGSLKKRNEYYVKYILKLLSHGKFITKDRLRAIKNLTDVCAICLQYLSSNDNQNIKETTLTKCTNCVKIFHEKCYKEWNQSICPLCKEEFNKKQEKEESLNESILIGDHNNSTLIIMNNTFFIYQEGHEDKEADEDNKKDLEELNAMFYISRDHAINCVNLNK